MTGTGALRYKVLINQETQWHQQLQLQLSHQDTDTNVWSEGSTNLVYKVPEAPWHELLSLDNNYSVNDDGYKANHYNTGIYEDDKLDKYPLLVNNRHDISHFEFIKFDIDNIFDEGTVDSGSSSGSGIESGMGSGPGSVGSGSDAYNDLTTNIDNTNNNNNNYTNLMLDSLTPFDDCLFPHSALSVSSSISLSEDEIHQDLTKQKKLNKKSKGEPLKWVDETNAFDKMANNHSSSEVDIVRKRLDKMKNRSIKKVSDIKDKDTKRQRNTLAARKYRERQRKDFEVLDNKIKQLEQELSKSKLETLWWKMESSKWEEQAKKSK